MGCARETCQDRPPVAARGTSARDRSGECGRSAASSRTCRGGRRSASVPPLTPPTHRSKGGRSWQVSRASLQQFGCQIRSSSACRLATDRRVTRSRWTGRMDASSAVGSWRGPEGAAVVRPWSGASRASVGAPTGAPRSAAGPSRSSGPAASPPTGRERRCPAPSTGPTAAAALRHVTTGGSGVTADRAFGAYPPGTAAFVTAVRDTAMKKAVARRADPVPRQRRAGPSGPANRVPTRSRVCRERERRGPPWAFCLSAARAHRAQPLRGCRVPSCARRSRPC